MRHRVLWSADVIYRMQERLGNRQTYVFKFCYTSLYTFFVSAILNEYCSAKNETALHSQGNTSDLYKLLDHNTWIDGYHDCQRVYNMTMASYYDIADKGKQFYNLYNQDLPIWLYAFEIVLTSGEALRIQSNEVSKYNNTFHCSNEYDASVWCCKSLIEAKDMCREKNLSLSQITPQSATVYAQAIYTNATIWTTGLNVSAFLKESDGLKIRCLLLDQNGLRTDQCNKTHRTLCIQGNTQSVIQYVKKAKLPVYTPSTTTRHSSSKSSSSPSKQDSNNPYQSTTVSSSTNQVPVYQDIWMDPVIRYLLIAVGTVICVVLFVAVCCCFCKFRRRAEHRKNSAHLAEAYSETADSIVMKETSVYETADTSEYAIPEDALKKAKHRESIGENEYDVLRKTNTTSKNYTGNAYNHVTLATLDGREENTYDVTNFGKQNAVIISPNDLAGNIYGDVGLKTISIEKKEEKLS